jgi:murein DD-endopeptidase MepM/ murein hydrolase activator NlpD
MSHYDPRDRHLTRGQKTLQKLFPERQVMLRSAGRLRSVRLSTGGQVVMAVASALVIGWVGFSSFMYLNHQVILEAKQEDVARARAAYKSLLAQVSVYRDKITVVTENLEKNHSHALTLAARNETLDKRLQAMESELASSEVERREAQAAKDQLVGHLQKLKSELQTAAGRSDKASEEDASRPASVALQQERTARERADLRQQLARLESEMADVTGASTPLMTNEVDAIEMELRRVVKQRDLAETENARLATEVDDLKGHLAEMENTQLALFQRFSSLARDRIGEIEDALQGTGLKVDDLIDGQREGGAQGGPFIPIDLGNWQEGTLRRTLTSLNEDVARWNTLQTLAETLPLGKPLRDYYITSTFGPRKDPMNGRVAVHQGLDLGAPYKSPVYATGPGKVIYAGWRGRYGRLVEIDHGNGIKTRFGHLNKVLARKGEMVDPTTRIGLLGNSGRSTGPHLHYEVLVDGKPVNPTKFIKAGVNVFKG